MKVDGLRTTTQPVSYKGPAPQDDTSSSPAGGVGDAYPPAPAPSQCCGPADIQGGGDTLLAGSLSVSLHFQLAQSYSSTQTAKTADGYMELRKSVERSVTADFKFDMAFLGKLDSTSQKMGGLGADVLNEFVGAASNLMSLNEQDLQKFTESADKLFNELSKATGGGDAFGGAKDMLKNSVTDFIHMVKGEIDKMSASPAQAALPVGAGPATGLLQGADGTSQAGAPNGPGKGSGIDFSKLYNEVTQKFDEAYASLVQGIVPNASKLINDNLGAFMDELKKAQDKNDVTKQDEQKRLLPPPEPKAA